MFWELPEQEVSDVWDHVSRKKEDGKLVQICSYCGLTKKTSQPMASRWALHLVDQCEKVDLDVSKQVYHSRKDTNKSVKEAGERRGFAAAYAAATSKNAMSFRFLNVNRELCVGRAAPIRFTGFSNLEGVMANVTGPR